MSYVKGIRMVFESRAMNGMIQTFTEAKKHGYALALYNGKIYASNPDKNPPSWFETGLTLDDFVV